MTDEVGELVLRHNYLQGQAVSVAEAGGWQSLDKQGGFMHALERAGKLEGAIEFLHDDDAMADRTSKRQGLTRPAPAALQTYATLALPCEIFTREGVAEGQGVY